MKKKIVIISAILSFASLGLAFFVKNPLAQSVFVNIFSVFLSVIIGIVVVNFYLEKNSRREAIESIYIHSQDAIYDFHNSFLNMIFAEFGKAEFTKIRDDYFNNNQDIKAISPSDRKRIYDLVKNHQTINTLLIEDIDSLLAELTMLVGWNLDPKLLSSCLDAKTSVRKFKKVIMDGSPAAIDGTTEHIIDIDNHAIAIMRMLKELGNLKT